MVLLSCISAAAAAPVANFSATPTSGNYSFNVQFHDDSTGAPVLWAWSFGDGTPNSTQQNPMHTYTYSGLFSPSLTVWDAGGVNSSVTNVNYINSSQIAQNSTFLKMQGAPKLVLLRVQTIWGKPITDATIGIQGISTTTGTWDWVMTMLNIPLNEAPIQNTYMSGTTDSLGETEFMMVPTTKYNISVTAPGYTFANTYLTPHDTEYTIVANPLGGDGWTAPTPVASDAVTVVVTTMINNDSYQGINVTYTDTSATTTGGFVNITQDGTLLSSTTIVANSFTINQNVNVPIGGSSAVVQVNATVSGQSIYRSFAVTFKGGAVSLGGLDPQLVYWGAMFLIIMTGMIAGATTSPQVSVMVCVEAWIFLSLGWLNPMVSKLGNEKVVGLFMLATFLSILWNFREGKRKETGR